MNIERTFIVEKSSARIPPLARSFLEKTGYRRVSDQPLVYQRGSRLGSWTSFVPSKWPAQITVGMRSLAADRTEVTCNLSVNDWGQFSVADERYWRTEAVAFEQALTSGKTDNTLLSRAELVGRRDRKLWLAFIVWSCTGIAVSGVVTYLVKEIFGW